MKPENQQGSPDDDTLQVPPELIRTLARLRDSKVGISPAVDAAILLAAKERMRSIRENRHPRIPAWLLWPLAAAACFLLAWVALQPLNTTGKTPAQPVALQEDAASVILREFSALYPNQVKAIIQDSHGIQLTLADKPDVAQGKALVLKVCQAQGCEEIITFSGQNIEVAGHQVTVRTESGGRVTLDGDQFLWSSDFKGNPAPGIHIASRRL
ncbi:MAG: hypothetical protein ABI600_15875 [Luteolibacter sp.]